MTERRDQCLAEHPALTFEKGVDKILTLTQRLNPLGEGGSIKPYFVDTYFSG